MCLIFRFFQRTTMYCINYLLRIKKLFKHTVGTMMCSFALSVIKAKFTIYWVTEGYNILFGETEKFFIDYADTNILNSIQFKRQFYFLLFGAKDSRFIWWNRKVYHLLCWNEDFTFYLMKQKRLPFIILAQRFYILFDKVEKFNIL